MVIYKITHKDSGKIYIGKSTKSGKRLDEYFGSGTYIKNALKKYGRDKFEREIIQVCNTAIELDEAEQYWIKYYNSYTPNGYNIHAGGTGGDSFFHLTECEKSKIFDKRRENNPMMYDKIWESRRRNGTDKYTGTAYHNIATANKVKAQKPEWRNNQSIAQHIKSSTEKKYVIKILANDELVELKNIRSVKDFVNNYNKENNIQYQRRANYWKLLYNHKTNGMILLEKRSANYE